MIDLGLLENLIRNANPKSTSETVVDEHFDQIVHFIEQENTKEAAKLIEKVFAKNVPDIRLIVYYFYAHFTEHGIKSLVKTFPLAKSLINDHAEILTPKNKTDKHIQSSLNWFFSHLLQRFKYYEKLHNSGKSHPIWKKSFSETSLEELEQLSEISKEFNHFFLENWPLSPTKDRILHLIKKIEDIQKIVIANQKPILEDIVQTKIEEFQEIQTEEDSNKDPIVDTEPVLEPLEENPDHVPNATNERESEVAAIVPFSDEIINIKENEVLTDVQQPDDTIYQELCDQKEIQNPSIPSFSILSQVDKETIGEPLHLFIQSLDQLSRKLKIFEALIEKDDYLKAAIVANDIDRLLENFDPLSYFPKLFAKYFSIFAKHVAALTEQYEKKDTLQVRTLEKLYRTDLEMFLDW